MEAAVQSLKKRKSAGVDNIPAELAQAGGEDVITDLTTICNKIWQTGKWPTSWTQSLIITLPTKGNLQQRQNYRTISLIRHPNKVMLKISTEKIEVARGEDYCLRKGRLQSREERHRADLRSENPLKEIFPAPPRPQLYLHRLQEGLRQDLECSFVDIHDEVQHQC